MVEQKSASGFGGSSSRTNCFEDYVAIYKAWSVVRSRGSALSFFFFGGDLADS